MSAWPSGQRRSASVSGRDQRCPACVGDSRDGRAKRGAGGVGCPARNPLVGCAARDTRSAHALALALRFPHPAHPTRLAHAFATRSPRPGLLGGLEFPDEPSLLAALQDEQAVVRVLGLAAE